MDRLYDKVNSRIQDEGLAMPFSKNVFLFAGGNRLGVFDARKMKDADNRTFMNAAFLCLFSAIPGDETVGKWTKAIETLPPAVFQKRFLCAIRNSRVARECGCSIFGLEAVFKRAEQCEAEAQSANEATQGV